ncbi:MAG: cytochrome P450 [Actinomycetota bacterium]
MDRPPLAHPTDPSVWDAGVPHETFAWLRANEPISFWDDLEGRRGFWLVARHDDLRSVSHDTATFSSRWGAVSLDDLDAEQLDARRTMLEEDPPRHTALRALVDEAFLPRAVRAYADAIEALTEPVLQAAFGRDRFDFVEAVAKEVPIRVLCRMLGVPERHTHDLVDWGNRMLSASDPDYADPELFAHDPSELRLLPFGHPAALRVFALADALADERRARPTDDVVSRIVTGEVDGEPLSPQEIRTMFVLLVIAGNETTRHTLSHGLLALLDHPDELARLRDDPAVSDRATEEVIRWATPINWHRRHVTSDTELRGRLLRAGDKLLLSFASANRDELVFGDPFALRLDRHPNPQVAFGRGGPHFCLGAHLARLEIAVVLRSLAPRLGRLRLDGPVERLRSDHINGIKRLPVAVA